MIGGTVPPMRLLFLCVSLALAACSSDPAPADAGTADTSPLDSSPVDVGDDRSALPDLGPRDTGLDAGTDAGFDVGFEAASQEIPGPDVVDAGAADVPRADASDATDTGSDAPADARISCGSLPAEPACTTSAQCAMCQPASSGEVWCCRANGTCGVSPGVFACP